VLETTVFRITFPVDSEHKKQLLARSKWNGFLARDCEEPRVVGKFYGIGEIR
jgi:hypothetical protein